MTLCAECPKGPDATAMGSHQIMAITSNTLRPHSRCVLPFRKEFFPYNQADNYYSLGLKGTLTVIRRFPLLPIIPHVTSQTWFKTNKMDFSPSLNSIFMLCTFQSGLSPCTNHCYTQVPFGCSPNDLLNIKCIPLLQLFQL